MSFKITKPGEYKTRRGEKAVIDGRRQHDGAVTYYPWFGVVHADDIGVSPASWTDKGEFNIILPSSSSDIIGYWQEETPATPTSLGFKKDNGKPKASLLPLTALMEVTKGFTNAMAPGSKYPVHNYRHGMDWTRPANAGFRHLVAWLNGQDNDSESGDNHLTSAIASLMMVLEMQLTNVGTDDRWPKLVEEQKNASSSNRR